MQLAATARTNPNKAAWMQYCLRCRKERPEFDFSREMTGSTSIVGVLCVPSIQELKMVETRKNNIGGFLKEGTSSHHWMIRGTLLESPLYHGWHFFDSPVPPILGIVGFLIIALWQAGNTDEIRRTYHVILLGQKNTSNDRKATSY